MSDPHEYLAFVVGEGGTQVTHTRQVAPGYGEDELRRFKERQPPYANDWIEVSGGISIPRDKIISVQLVGATESGPVATD